MAENDTTVREDVMRDVRGAFYRSTGILGNILQRREDGRLSQEVDEQTERVITNNTLLSSIERSFVETANSLATIAKILQAQNDLMNEESRSIVEYQKKQDASERFTSAALTPYAATGDDEPSGGIWDTLKNLLRKVGRIRTPKGKPRSPGRPRSTGERIRTARSNRIRAQNRLPPPAPSGPRGELPRTPGAAPTPRGLPPIAYGGRAPNVPALPGAKPLPQLPGPKDPKEIAKRFAKAQVIEDAKIIRESVDKAVKKQMTGGKMLGRALIVLQAYFIAERLLDGDFVGAGLVAASGIPVAGIAAIGALVAHDAYRSIYGISFAQDYNADPDKATIRMQHLGGEIRKVLDAENRKYREEMERQELERMEREYGIGYDIPPSPPTPVSRPTTAGSSGFVLNGSEDDIKAMIINHEGIRTKPYQDTEGNWTVGVGHLIGKNISEEDKREWTSEQISALFEKDYEYHKQAASKIAGFGQMNRGGKAALIDLTFNMGPNWISKWPDLKEQLASGQYQAAADNLANSKWATQVQQDRVDNITKLIRNADQQNAEIGEMSLQSEIAEARQRQAKRKVLLINVNNTSVAQQKSQGALPPGSRQTTAVT